MNDYNAEAKTITGESLEQCREKLRDMGVFHYEMIDRCECMLHTGFFGLFQKPGVQVKYVERSNNEPPARSRGTAQVDLQKNQEDILKMLSKNESISNLKQIARVNEKIDNLTTTFSQVMQQMTQSGEVKNETITKIEENLEENEFTKDFIKGISSKIRATFSLEQLDDFSLVEKTVVDWIGESIEVAPVKAFRPPHVIVIVGPTGVGKTTTIAKLAAQFILTARNQGKSKPHIKMVTIDKTRVAAEEQLKHYCEVMSVEVNKAETAEDLKKLFNLWRDSTDYILIDTSGYSPNDSKHIAEMKEILTVSDLNPDVYLAVVASTKAKDIRNIIQNYEPFGYTSVIVTKCDETEQFGNLISVLHEKHKAISYVTDGQGVARNIKRFNIIDFLIRLNNFRIDREHIEEVFGEKEN